MKKILFALMLCASFVTLHADSDDDYAKIDIYLNRVITRPVTRTLVLPLECHVNMDANTLVTCFSEDLGMVNISVVHLDSGESVHGQIDSSLGHDIMPIPSYSGSYEVIYETASGDKYIGYMQL
jgi:hypothetical protein